MNINTKCHLGVGLRPLHYEDVLNNKAVHLDWFEVVSENYIDSFGYPREVLQKVRRFYEVALHGVSLNIGSADPLNFDYLKKLKDLSDQIQPFIISDHCCFTGVDGINGHDLYPIPYTKQSLNHIVERIDKVQNFLKRNILIENISTYLLFKENEFTEWDFLNELVKRAGCGLLLDLNNVFVNSFNHEFDPYQFVNSIDISSVQQIHLAGFTDQKTYYFDTHSKPVSKEVWSLYKEFCKKGCQAPVLLEWDEDIPSFQKLQKEVLKAKKYMVVN